MVVRGSIAFDESKYSVSKDFKITLIKPITISNSLDG